MGDIVEFLKARLDEDEAAANQLEDIDDTTAGIDVQMACGYPCESYLTIGKARVFRDVAAKRAIIDLHPHRRFLEPLSADSPFEEDHRAAFDEDPKYVGCVRCDWDPRFEEVTPGWWCETLRRLAAIWAEHPDFDEAWTVRE